MSDLHITLLVIGVVVIVAVIVYNRVQEMRFRKRAERTFGVQPADALLHGAEREGRTGSQRIEPQLPAASEAAEVSHGPRQEPQAPNLDAEGSTGAASASTIDYVAEIRAAQPVPAEPLKALVSTLGELAPRVHLSGRESDGGAWQALDPASPGGARQVMVSLQLVNRRGAVSSAELAALQSAIAVCAAALPASAIIPETGPFMAKAQALDALCAEVDVVVGINVVAPAGRPFGGTRLRGLAEAAGFRLQPSGVFTFGDGQGHVLFTLENGGQRPFDAETLRQLTTDKVTLLLDVPRQRDGVRAFNQMVAVGRQLAVALGGALVDDNRVAVTEPGLEQIRNQLRAIYATMQARGVPSGSADALRLFS
jgi:FtsZ-interacting cell division protein ZipA